MKTKNMGTKQTKKIDQKHLRTFCIIETGGEGGDFEAVSERQIINKLYYALLPKNKTARNDL